MHSFLSRLNNVSAFLFTVLGAATFAVFMQTYFLNYTIPVDISVSNVRIKPVNDYAAARGRSDMVSLRFNIHADLSPIYNWNVKMLYVYLVAKYETQERVLNELTIWDKYYHRFESTIINEENRVIPKQGPMSFYFSDDGTNLRGKNVTYVLRWTVVPNAGYMRNVDGKGEIILPMPKDYNW